MSLFDQAGTLFGHVAIIAILAFILCVTVDAQKILPHPIALHAMTPVVIPPKATTPTISAAKESMLLLHLNQRVLAGTETLEGIAIESGTTT